jgi:uroporphyrinogen-III synthase
MTLALDFEAGPRVKSILASQTQGKGFAGLRVLALESRRAPEMAKLIATFGGQPVVAPSMREAPLESNSQAVEFARTLANNGFDMIIFLTGVGTRALTRVVETLYARHQFVAQLKKIPLVARGPKPIAALQELGVAVTLAVPEPNTWRELLRALDENKPSLPLEGRRVALQEYGVSNPELVAGLRERGARVTCVPVYEWALPEDTSQLREAIAAITRGEIDVALFTTSIQVTHLLQVAASMNLEEPLRRAFGRILVGSIGPTTSERLRESGLTSDFEPTHPKMGLLVSETAERSAALLEGKRGRISA